ncbi:MAG: hypothetical protein ACRDKA_12100 [Actinomycetota bacterium]
MPDDYQDALARIERDVQEGRESLGRLGFWRLVRRIKLEPGLAAHWAEEVGRIDRVAFERWVRPRFHVWLGNAVLLVASVILVAFVPIAGALARGAAEPEPVLPGLMLLAAAGGLSASLHDPAHWLVGRLLGMRFVWYFFDGPLRIQPGIKVDYASYLRASPAARAWMHASGAVVSKVAPFAVFAAAYLPHRSASYDLFPPWAMWGMLAIGAFQIVTDIVFSTRKSDWKKVRRELRVGRAQRG